MTSTWKRIASTFAAIVFGFGISLTACDVEKTEEGEMPEVDYKPGEAPEYDVNTAEVDVETEKRTVETPEVDVGTEEQEVEVPDVNVTSPDEEQ